MLSRLPHYHAAIDTLGSCRVRENKNKKDKKNNKKV